MCDLVGQIIGRMYVVTELKDALIGAITQFLDGFPPEVIVMIISSFPILELRGGLPAAIGLYNMTVGQAYFWSVLGNMLPVVPLLLLFQPISRWMIRFAWYERFYNWLYKRTLKRSSKVERFGAFGLILFTAVPLPVTGAWTACAAACFFHIRFSYAFTAIFTGVLIAGLVVGGISQLVVPLFQP